MKIILTQDVPKLGRKHEVKNVADGFGRNFILARGLGLVATTENLKKLEARRQQQLLAQKAREEFLKQSLDELKGTAIKLTAKASPEGHLFAGIHPAEIVAALKQQKNIDLDSTLVDLDKPIKQIGEYDIAVRVGDRTGHFHLAVDRLE